MFESVGWGEILVLVVAGLFILGPERLPSAAAWVGRTTRQVREYATGARDQLSRELGPEFEELRKPLEDLRGLRNFSPGNAVRRTLFDDDPPLKPNGYGGPNGSTANGSTANGAAPVNGSAAGADGASAAPSTVTPGDRPPIDPDAT